MKEMKSHKVRRKRSIQKLTLVLLVSPNLLHLHISLPKRNYLIRLNCYSF